MSPASARRCWPKVSPFRWAAAINGCNLPRIYCRRILPGVSIFNQQMGEFRFLDGPVFANVVLADEINRASPKTQAALLECMEERQVTIDGQTRILPGRFSCWPRKTPSNSKAPIRCRNHNSTASCCARASATPIASRNGRSCCGKTGEPAGSVAAGDRRGAASSSCSNPFSAMHVSDTALDYLLKVDCGHPHAS